MAIKKAGHFGFLIFNIIAVMRVRLPMAKLVKCVFLNNSKYECHLVKNACEP